MITQHHGSPEREALIDLDAIAENTARLKRIGGGELIAVVKADGYGHGAVLAARAALAGGADRLGVADVSEALQLRAAGIDAPIVAWLHGAKPDFTAAVAANIELGISTFAQLEAAASQASKAAKIHLKVDTGLSRNGFSQNDWQRIVLEAGRLERVGKIKVVGIFSHLSGTSKEEDQKQLARFVAAIAEAAASGIKPELKHLAATAAIFDLPEARFNCVRAGIGLYGLSPFAERSSADLGLRPAMTLRAPVVATRELRPGDGVSYGFDYRAESDGHAALVPLGYADGVPRQASGAAFVTLADQRFPVAGRIAMDQIVVATGQTQARIGESVTLFGDPQNAQISVDEWADAAGTINYEIVTRVGPRVPRKAVGALADRLGLSS